MTEDAWKKSHFYVESSDLLARQETTETAVEAMMSETDWVHKIELYCSPHYSDDRVASGNASYRRCHTYDWFVQAHADSELYENRG